MEYPKIIIVSRLVWDDASNSNTLGNLFANYDPEKIARIYIETKTPNTTCCHLFYQISEFSLVKKLYKWKLQTGEVIDTKKELVPATKTEDTTASQEASTMGFVRGHRSWVFSLMREVLWYFNGWKTPELMKFINDFNPDIVWLDGSPLILMNRLNNYVLKVANKPAVTFLMDDVYDYRSCTSLWDKIYKFFLRKHVKRTVDKCQHVFVASPKMKEEYDQAFNVKSTFISKSIDSSKLSSESMTVNDPIKLIYLGNVLIGRLDCLCTIAQAMKEINKTRVKIQLDIYTGDPIAADKNKLLDVDGVQVHGLVPYNQVPDIIAKSDVQVFVESINGKNMNVARLSFSTKIIDYIGSGKCILAVGPKDVAPMEYFRNEDAALVASSGKEVMDCLLKLINKQTIQEYAKKAVVCGQRNHNKNLMDSKIFDTLIQIKNKKNDKV